MADIWVCLVDADETRSGDRARRRSVLGRDNVVDTTWINYREERRIKRLIEQAVGPYGTVSKFVRACVREGLQKRGLLEGDQRKQQAA